MKRFLSSACVLILCVEATVLAQQAIVTPSPVASPVTLKHRLRSFPTTSESNTTAVGVGDVNGDGHDDFALLFQTRFLPSTNPFDLGSFVIYSGIDQSVIHTMSGLLPSGVSSTFGLCSVGDQNGDGFDDIVVSFPIVGTSGEFRFLSGLDLSVLQSIFGPLGTENGEYLVRLDDMNNDGVRDFGFSCQSSANPSLNKVRVVSATTGATIIDITGPNNDLMIGGIPGGFVPVGDVNGDGTSDVLIGEPFWNNNVIGMGFNWVGRARVFSGADGTVIHAYTGSLTTGGFLGNRVAGLGDINSDGAADFAFAKGNGIWVYSGFDGTLISSFSHPNRWVSSLAPVGDVDGDGITDIAFGLSDQNPYYLSSTDNHQEIRIISGASFSLIGKLPAPDGAIDKAMDLVAVGDINGDGTDDFVLTSIMNSSISSQNPQPPEFPDVQILVYANGISPYDSLSSSSGNAPALDLEWIPADGLSNSLRGTLKTSGATALATGLIVASLASADLPIQGVDLLVAVDSTNLLGLAVLGANLAGEFIVADISRASFPQLAGTSIYSQVFEIAPTLRASNAMKIVVIP